MPQFFIGKASDFVKGDLMKPVRLAREIASEKRRVENKLKQLESLPREIDRAEARIREMEMELSEYHPENPRF